jgi:AAA15 family ATPase/GTPase
MIIRITLDNFLSFNNEQSLYLLPSESYQDLDFIPYCKTNDFHILFQALIMGANGSGKTNLYKALQFLKQFVKFRNGILMKSLPQVYCNISDDNMLKTTVLDFAFLINEDIYEYKISKLQNCVFQEGLYVNGEFVSGDAFFILYDWIENNLYLYDQHYFDSLPVPDLSTPNLVKIDEIKNILFSKTKPNTNSVIYIDNFDDGIDHSTCCEIVSDYIKNVTSDSRNQLIINTHAITLMDYALIDRDEIFVLEVNSKHETKIIGVGDYRLPARTKKRG